jgi:MFS family permease
MKSPQHNIRLLAWFNFFCDLRFYAPVAILYFAEVAGSFALGMSVFSAIFISQSVLEVPTGVLSDRLGRKGTITAGALAGAAGLMLYSCANGYWLLLLGGVLEGAARAFYSGNNEALLYDTLAQSGAEHRFPELLGKTSSLFQAGLAAGALGCGLLAEHGLIWVMRLSIIPQLCCLFISLGFVEPRAARKSAPRLALHVIEAWRKLRARKNLKPLLAASITEYSFGEAAHEFEAAFFKTVLPLWAIGVLRTFTHAFAAASFWLAGAAIRRFTHRRVLIAGTLISGIMESAALAWVSLLSPVLISLTSLFFGATCTAKGSLLQEHFSEEQRATMGSLVSLMGSLAYAVVAVGIGMIGDSAGPAAALLTAVAAKAAVVVLYQAAFKQ